MKPGALRKRTQRGQDSNRTNEKLSLGELA